MKRTGILVVLLALTQWTARAQSPETLFQQANQLYQQGKLPEAAALYESIIRTGVVSGQLYYNLGNAYYKSGNIPRAIVMYERALRLTPGDDDLRYNLQLANLMIADRIEPAPRLFIWEYWSAVKGLFSVRSAMWCGYSGFLLLVLSIGSFVLVRSYALRKAALIAGTGGAAVLVFFLVVCIAKLSDGARTDEAILQSAIVTVKNSPDPKSSDAFVLHAGVKVQVVDRVGDWVKIRLADGKVGWMESGTAEII